MQPIIVIIHDNWSEKYPIVVELREKYGKENVIYISNPQKGIDYILSVPPRKMIVLLDYNFNTGEPTGGEVFKKVREKSSLIYVIIVTKSEYKDIDPVDFADFVNNHALAISVQSASYLEIVELVEKAAHELDIRADVIIESWIASKTSSERKEPYLKWLDGKTYSLDDILESIRSQNVVGKEIEKHILGLAIDLVMKKLKSEDA